MASVELVHHDEQIIEPETLENVLMIPTRIVFSFAVVAAAATMALAACSSSDSSSNTSGTGDGGNGNGNGTGTGNGDGSGSGGFKNCSGSGGGEESKCTKQELEAYSSCINTNCDSTYKECYGDNYKSGSFGGACGEYISCFNACDCNDTACYQKCPAPSQACTTCAQKIGTCAQKCTIPDCMKPDVDSGTGSGKTCADLSPCCAGVSDADMKSACEQAAASGSDATCDALYGTFCK